MNIGKDIKRVLLDKNATQEIMINDGKRRGLLNIEPGSISAARRTVYTVSYVFLTHTDEETRAYLIDDEAVINGKEYRITNVIHDQWGMTKVWFGAQRSQGEKKSKTDEENELNEFGL